MDFAYDEDKFKELLLYVAYELRDDPTAGAVKLNKVLYYAEFGHVRATGHPITGAEFQKLRWGPAPRRLRPVRRQLIEQGDARTETTVYLGYRQDRLVPIRIPVTDRFTEDELESIRQALTALATLNGTESSDLTHGEVGWQMVGEGETIPYEAAYLRPPVVTPSIRRHAQRLAAKLGLT